MGRAGRYTLSVMAWVAAYAGWSSVIGLVVAAVTGDRPRSVSPGVSALLTVVGPLVPTLVALWFNDWARDGFPSREQVRAARSARASASIEVAEPAAEAPAADAQVAGAAATESAALSVPSPAPAVPDATRAPVPATPAAPIQDAPPTVTRPLAGPATPAAASTPPGAFPVAPLLRDRD